MPLSGRPGGGPGRRPFTPSHPPAPGRGRSGDSPCRRIGRFGGIFAFVYRMWTGDRL